MSSLARLTPIGLIRSPFREPAGTPIQPSYAAEVEGTVEVFPEYMDGLLDLDGFERIWLFYWLEEDRSNRTFADRRFEPNGSG